MSKQVCIMKKTTVSVIGSAITATILFLSSAAHADLVGHWISGAENYENGSSLGATHDGYAVGTGSITFSTDIPPGATGKSLDLPGNAGLVVSNSATTDAGYVNTFDNGVSSLITIAFWAKGFPGTWNPWVSKRGESGQGYQLRRWGSNPYACFTIRGIDNNDGTGSTINVNESPAVWHHYAGTWNKSTGRRILYVDGVVSHTNINATSQNMAFAPDSRLAIGARDTIGTPGNYFDGLLYDVRIYNEELSHNSVIGLIPLVAPDDLSGYTLDSRAILEWADQPMTATGYTISASNTVTSVVTTEADVTSPYTFTGLTNGQLYHFRIRSDNAVKSSAYSAPLTLTVATGTANDMLTFDFGALGVASIRGTNVVKNVPPSTDVSSLAPTYTVSPGATGDAAKPSGSTVDFTTPQVYTVTAEDGTPTNYLVTVIKNAPASFHFDTGLQGWTQIWPTESDPYPDVWFNGYLGPFYGQYYPGVVNVDEIETRFARSPAFYLNTLGPLTFQLAGGQSTKDTPVAPSAVPELAITNRDGGEGGFAGLALRDVATDTYVLWRRRTGSANTWQDNQFSAEELAPFANDGKKYTLDYIDYNKGSWGWTCLDNISIPGTLVVPVMTSFTLPPYDPAVISGTNITLRVAFGANLATLAPFYTTSPEAPFTSGTPASGAVVAFSSGPVEYTLVSEDLTETNVYLVTIEVLPDPADALVGHWVSFYEDLIDRSTSPDDLHDGSIVGTAANLGWSADTPPGFAGSSLDLTTGGAGVRINNSRTNDVGYADTFDQGISNQFTVTFWAKGFPATWNPWVAKRGDNVNVGGVNIAQGWQIRRFSATDNPCFTLRGLDDSDGSGCTVNVNDNEWRHFAGVWNQAEGKRTLYINGAIANINYNTAGQTMVLAPGQALTIGARADGANGYQSYFQGRIYDVRIYNQALFSNQVHTAMTTPLEAQDPEAKIKLFGLPGNEAVINQTTGEIIWTFPFGVDVSQLAPEFAISPGATCDRISGETNNFNMTQSYVVTSSDSLIQKTYTVKILVGFNFNDGTLQGWNNRVWDTNANDSAGGWVDLPPNVTTNLSSINGGVIVPASVDNGLFVPNNGAVWVSGQIDNHLNTLWLRSPEFYLNRSGDLTVQLAQGITHTGTDPASEADIPYAAALNAGWMGVAIRRVSTDEFVLVKPKTVGQSNNYYTFTFTAAELRQLSSYEPYTLELINADRGSWGWITMDNVIIPGNSTQVLHPGTLIIMR